MSEDSHIFTGEKKANIPELIKSAYNHETNPVGRVQNSMSSIIYKTNMKINVFSSLFRYSMFLANLVFK